MDNITKEDKISLKLISNFDYDTSKNFLNIKLVNLLYDHIEFINLKKLIKNLTYNNNITLDSCENIDETGLNISIDEHLKKNLFDSLVYKTCFIIQKNLTI